MRGSKQGILWEGSDVLTPLRLSLRVRGSRSNLFLCSQSCSLGLSGIVPQWNASSRGRELNTGSSPQFHALTGSQKSVDCWQATSSASTALPACGRVRQTYDILPCLSVRPSVFITRKMYRGADKSLALPGRKQATASEDFEFHVAYFVLAFSTQIRGFKLGRSRRIFKGEKILTTPSFGGEVKPSVPCRRFAACKRSLNGVEVVISTKLPDNILAHSSTFRRWDLSRRSGRGGTWWWKVGTSKKLGESNGKLQLRTCPGCSVPEPYQSPDWTLVSAQTGPRPEYQ